MSVKKIWNDPVWSKVIANGIIVALAFVLTIIWSMISAKQNQINFKTAFVNFWSYKISLWIVVVIAILLLIIYWGWKYCGLNKFVYDDETIKLDKAMFDKIRNELLPQEGTIGFLRHNNFAGFSFDLEKIDDLDNIEYEDRKSDFEFLNPDLEKIKIELINKISHFTSEISMNTFPTNAGFQSVPSEWEVEQPERFWTIVNSLHSTASEI